MLRLIRRIFGKKGRKVAKNMSKRGKSTRNGNSKSPYQKYDKRPFRYSPAYYAWKASMMGGKKPSGKKYEDAQKEQYKEAA